VKTFDMPLLKTKDLPARYPLNCESRAKGHGRQRLPKSLKRQRVVFDLAENEKQCPHCRGEMKQIGEEISERLEKEFPLVCAWILVPSCMVTHYERAPFVPGRRTGALPQTPGFFEAWLRCSMETTSL
jgi:hypothetical protein